MNYIAINETRDKNILKALYYLYPKYAILNKNGKTLFENPEPKKLAGGLFTALRDTIFQKKTQGSAEEPGKKLVFLNENEPEPADGHVHVRGAYSKTLMLTDKGNYLRAPDNMQGLPLNNWYLDVAHTQNDSISYLIIHADEKRNFPDSTLIRVEAGSPQPLASLLAVQEGSSYNFRMPIRDILKKRKLDLEPLVNDLRTAYKKMEYVVPLQLAIYNEPIGHRHPRVINIHHLVAEDGNTAGDAFESVLDKHAGIKGILKVAGNALWEGKIEGYSGICMVGNSTMVGDKILD